MELNQLKERLKLINNTSVPVGICIHIIKKQEDNSEVILNADISQNLADELKEIFVNEINEKIINNSNINLRNISATHETVDTLFLYDLDEFPEKLSVINEFNPFTDYPDFSFSNDDIQSIKAIIITIGSEDNYFSIYKHVYPVTIVRQDKMLGLIPRGNRFEKLSSSILQINTSIDFLFADNTLIVNNLKTFASAYGYNEIVKNQARIKLELISSLDLIDNIEELHLFMDNIKYAKRVLRIQAESPVLQLEKSTIVSFISNHPRLSRRIRLNSTSDKIVLDTDVSKVIVIGIFNDDYLKSNLTDLDYESENKLTLADEEE
ncbi:hypothetical protein A0O34_20615 [Chryseobacterium glaciei]|uniref:DUF4868 domain-containing protein n=1 Tax=Chryseobacterium glaciei TaxID=1685010 RepID=A0A172Y0J9_9FLAO|nr:anti-phage protein KwaB [Chryseobacterium glaciei]ANF52769.1 hypothetical protein A0O34_20615 [Chryseobacterium glaciei]